jgi:threonine/homoserine/homoserine lactone efflux protein
MDILFFAKGLLIGFSIAAPVGPIGVLCIQRTIKHGRLSGLFTGLGAATADMLYGCVAAFGLTVVSEFLVGQQLWLKGIGGAFLLYLGAKTFFSKPSQKVAAQAHKGLVPDYLSALVLTLTNPMTIFSFIAIFAGLGVGSLGGGTAPLWVVAGVFIGSALWWLILSYAAGLFRKKFDVSALAILNKISGLIIVLFGVFAFASVFDFLYKSGP